MLLEAGSERMVPIIILIGHVYVEVIRSTTGRWAYEFYCKYDHHEASNDDCIIANSGVSPGTAFLLLYP